MTYTSHILRYCRFTIYTATPCSTISWWLKSACCISSIICNIPPYSTFHISFQNHLLRILSSVYHNIHILLQSHDVFRRLSDTLISWHFPYQKEIPCFAVCYFSVFSFSSVLIITSDSVKSSSQCRH